MTALLDVSREQVATLDELVDLAVGMQRSITAMQAGMDGVLALASRWATAAASDADEADVTFRAVAAELGAALRVSDRTVQRRMSEADFKVDRFPAVWQAQGAGRISAGHARVIVDAGDHLEDPVAREAYSARVLEFAEDESPNRLRPIAARIAERFQPRSLEERHEDAREERGVWVKDGGDGMAELGILGPATLVHGAFDRLTGMAKAVAKAAKAEAEAAKGAAQAGAAFCPAPQRAMVACAAEAFDAAAGPADADAALFDGADIVAAGPDARTLGQRRADLALDLLLTGAPAGHDTPDGLLAVIVPHVSVTVPVTTLIGAEGVDAPPAELDGRIPVDIDTARLLAGAASGWDRILTHPITGAVLAVDRYRPTAPMRRQLQARDQRCRFLTCGMPSCESDLDHTIDAALGGATEEDNLGDLCRRHHVLKHHSPWHVEQLGGGLLEWTSPTGRVYIDKPPPQNTVTFTDTNPPPGTPPIRPGTPDSDAWATTPAELLAPF